MKHIQHNWKVKVNVPREYSANQKVVIVGEKDPVERAKTYIEKLIWNAQNQSKGHDKQEDGNVDDFERRRGTELKHGRVAIYAAMGFITPEYFRLPGYLPPSAGLEFADVPNSLAAVGKVPVG
eukprot:3963226-Heterocapsa_arctica.AAC.1